jgi:hypothetical protein
MKLVGVVGRSRITITLPAAVVRAIDRREKDRSRFVLEAVRRELDRLDRVALQRSLQNPHPESADGTVGERLAAGSWGLLLPLDEDAAALVDWSAGKAVRWVPGRGWETEERE